MCDDHLGTGRPADPKPSLTRRNFLYGSAALAALAAVPRLPLHSPARAVTNDGTSAYSMAMHIHSSFSELYGSMEAQLTEATKNAVDVLWWTEHDWRMDGWKYRDTVHFTSLTKEAGAPGQGGDWHWVPKQQGPVASKHGGIVTHPATPNDPDPHGSLSLSVTSSSRSPATFGYYADSEPSDWNYRDNLTGQQISLDVLLEPGWQRGCLEISIVSSWRPATAGRPAGYYSIQYEIVPGSGGASHVTQGTKSFVTIPVQTGSWTTVTVTPSEDIAKLWPDVDNRDFALYKFSLNAVSTGDAVSGYFGYLRINRANGGNSCLQLQQAMMADSAASFPRVVQHQGVEVSWKLPHVNWYGNNITVPNYQGVTHPHYLNYVIEQIHVAHQAGGVVSYNHPYGTEPSPPLPASRQNALLTETAKTLLASKVYGCDILEAGYDLRAGVNLAHHVALWDIMSRNGLFLTGTGVSDDHGGNAWQGEPNNWTTSVWSPSTSQADLLAAVVAGRAWAGSLIGYRGSLDLLADGSCPMGSVSVSTATTRRLTVSATDVPTGGSLQVVQGPVDRAGDGDLSPGTQVIASYPAADLASGKVTLPVDNRSASFVRTQVVSASGELAAFSNPVWLLRSTPSGGIPTPRGA